MPIQLLRLTDLQVSIIRALLRERETHYNVTGQAKPARVMKAIGQTIISQCTVKGTK